MNTVKISEQFQYSINLKLDLQRIELIESFIPTAASIKILALYLDDFFGDKREKSTLLIGPYGKGKSHVLLVLLYLLRPTDDDVTRRLIGKIKKIDQITGARIEDYIAKKRKVLPVIISFGQDSLEHYYRLALERALEQNGMQDIIPNNYYREALRIIEEWKSKFVETYQLLEQRISMDIRTFCSALKEQDENVLREFQRVYPSLTAGTVFQPLIQTDVMDLYADINDLIQRQFGYAGMVVVFDEFGKFMESETKESISADMNLVQGMCETATKSAAVNPMYQIFVTHKAIKEYDGYLNQKVIDTFTGVEGRLHEHAFVTDDRHNYDLVKNVIQKTDAFETLALNWEKNAEENFEYARFQSDFKKDQKDFIDTVVKGCYPMTPITTFLLLKISEKAAQNERSLITFLANPEENTLASYIRDEKDSMKLATPELIYDYFAPLLKKDVQNIRNHKEWQKAEVALQSAVNETEIKIIKTICLIRIVGLAEKIEATLETLKVALDMPLEQVKESISQLEQRELVLYRDKIESYVLRQKVDLDIEGKVVQLENYDFANISLTNELPAICKWDFELPRRYNDEYCMTRYFRYLFMEWDSFLKIQDAKSLLEDTEGQMMADGTILLMTQSDTDISEEEIMTHLDEIHDARILLIAPRHFVDLTKVVRRYLALEKLKASTSDTNHDKVIEEEIEIMAEDCKYKIDWELDRMYQTGADEKNAVIYSKIKRDCTCSLNEVLSQICFQIYKNSPEINHELINRKKVTAQIRKARGEIVHRILEDLDMNEWNKGTSAEATIYRATLVSKGVVGAKEKDQRVAHAMKEMDLFFTKAAGTRRSFTELYDVLCGETIGLREGVIPIYLAWRMREMRKMPIIYRGDQEFPVDRMTLDAVNVNPSKYELFVEENAARDSSYLNRLEEIFVGEKKDGIRWQYRMSYLVNQMQRWVRNLPICARQMAYKDRGITLLLNKLGQGRLHPHEFLFETIPLKVCRHSSLSDVPQMLETMKIQIEHYDIDLIEEMKQFTKLCISENESSLCPVFNHWFRAHINMLKQSVLSEAATKVLGMSEANRASDEEILSTLSTILTGKYMQDWSEPERKLYQQSFQQIVEEINDFETEDKSNLCHVLVSDSTGNIIDKYLPEVAEDPTIDIFKSEMENVLEEIADSLDREQKIKACLDVLQSLINNR